MIDKWMELDVDVNRFEIKVKDITNKKFYVISTKNQKEFISYIITFVKKYDIKTILVEDVGINLCIKDILSLELQDEINVVYMKLWRI